MPHPNIRLLALPLVLLSAFLLLSIRLEARWIGGIGKVAPCPAELQTSTAPLAASFTRGEVMKTETSQRAVYQTCDASFYVLDERTEAELASYPHLNFPTFLELLQGRLVVGGTADIKTRNVVIHVAEGMCEIVHYSWRDEVDVTSLTPGACSVANGPLFPVATTVRLQTTTGLLISESAFDAQQSSAAPFYDWAREQGYF